MTAFLSARDFDVLIGGGGNAALCAAITAAARGARVLVLEAAPKVYRGGNGRHTRNFRLAHDAASETLTGPYPVDEYWDDLMRVTGDETDKDLARFTLEGSARLPEWLGRQGVRFQAALGGTLGLARTNAFYLGGGKALMNTLYRTAERLGVTVRYDAPVTGLAIEDGRFVSATIRHGEATHRIEARTFIAAAGGFEANIDWLKEVWGEATDGQSAMAIAFLSMLLLTGLTGLLLLVLRSTPAMGIALAVHLGFVLALFVSLPYGKFVHGLYRFAALVRYASERKIHGKS
jgi:tricarballylate dehydrogenase